MHFPDDTITLGNALSHHFAFINYCPTRDSPFNNVISIPSILSDFDTYHHYSFPMGRLTPTNPPPKHLHIQASMNRVLSDAVNTRSAIHEVLVRPFTHGLPDGPRIACTSTRLYAASSSPSTSVSRRLTIPVTHPEEPPPTF